MTFRLVLLATAAMTLPLAARAQPTEGLFVGAGAGANWLMRSGSDVDLPILRVLGGNAGSGRSRLSWDTGWAGLASIGWGFGNGLRLEVEGNLRENDLDGVSIYGSRATATGGRARSYGALVNAVYDFTVPGWPVSPYLGLGVGYVWHRYDGLRGRFGPLQGVVDDTDGRFAYQAIAGLSLPLGAPGLSLTAEYRFLGTLLPEMQVSVRNQATGAVIDRGRLEVGNFNHSLLIGLRYAFNAPSPAPAAAPRFTAPAQVDAWYFVFFDFDSAELSERGRQIITEAVQTTRRQGTTRLELPSHADRSGDLAYNRRLSQRRGETVAAELVRQGIARSQITIQAFGESRPLYPTADGVREPQNRRVEINMR